MGWLGSQRSEAPRESRARCPLPGCWGLRLAPATPAPRRSTEYGESTGGTYDLFETGGEFSDTTFSRSRQATTDEGAYWDTPTKRLEKGTAKSSSGSTAGRDVVISGYSELGSSDDTTTSRSWATMTSQTDYGPEGTTSSGSSRSGERSGFVASSDGQPYWTEDTRVTTIDGVTKGYKRRTLNPDPENKSYYVTWPSSEGVQQQQNASRSAGVAQGEPANGRYVEIFVSAVLSPVGQSLVRPFLSSTAATALTGAVGEELSEGSGNVTGFFGADTDGDGYSNAWFGLGGLVQRIVYFPYDPIITEVPDKLQVGDFESRVGGNAHENLLRGKGASSKVASDATQNAAMGALEAGVVGKVLGKTDDAVPFGGGGNAVVDSAKGITTSYGKYVRRADDFKHALDPDHVRAALREKAGQVVKLKPDGTPYDHLTETRNAMSGAKRHINVLNKHLNDQSLSAADRTTIQGELGELSNWLDRAEGILGELAN